MGTATAKRISTFGPSSAGILMTPREFDRAKFVNGWRYELIRGFLIVSPIPSENERDANGELEHLLRMYRDLNAEGSALNSTLSEHTVTTKANRRRADRVIWAGLGRRPRKGETPTIVVEFVSPGKRDWTRDYEEKRDEYLEIGVKEYWVIDRFRRSLTVFSKQGLKVRKRIVQENETYTTALLPGFQLAIARLLAAADCWPEIEPDEA